MSSFRTLPGLRRSLSPTFGPLTKLIRCTPAQQKGFGCFRGFAGGRRSPTQPLLLHGAQISLRKRRGLGLHLDWDDSQGVVRGADGEVGSQGGEGEGNYFHVRDVEAGEGAGVEVHQLYRVL